MAQSEGQYDLFTSNRDSHCIARQPICLLLVHCDLAAQNRTLKYVGSREVVFYRRNMPLTKWLNSVIVLFLTLSFNVVEIPSR